MAEILDYYRDHQNTYKVIDTYNADAIYLMRISKNTRLLIDARYAKCLTLKMSKSSKISSLCKGINQIISEGKLQLKGRTVIVTTTENTNHLTDPHAVCGKALNRDYPSPHKVIDYTKVLESNPPFTKYLLDKVNELGISSDFINLDKVKAIYASQSHLPQPPIAPSVQSPCTDSSICVSLKDLLPSKTSIDTDIKSQHDDMSFSDNAAVQSISSEDLLHSDILDQIEPPQQKLITPNITQQPPVESPPNYNFQYIIQPKSIQSIFNTAKSSINQSQKSFLAELNNIQSTTSEPVHLIDKLIENGLYGFLDCEFSQSSSSSLQVREIALLVTKYKKPTFEPVFQFVLKGTPTEICFEFLSQIEGLVTTLLTEEKSGSFAFIGNGVHYDLIKICSTLGLTYHHILNYNYIDTGSSEYKPFWKEIFLTEDDSDETKLPVMMERAKLSIVNVNHITQALFSTTESAELHTAAFDVTLLYILINLLSVKHLQPDKYPQLHFNVLNIQ